MIARAGPSVKARRKCLCPLLFSATARLLTSVRFRRGRAAPRPWRWPAPGPRATRAVQRPPPPLPSPASPASSWSRAGTWPPAGTCPSRQRTSFSAWTHRCPPERLHSTPSAESAMAFPMLLPQASAPMTGIPLPFLSLQRLSLLPTSTSGVAVRPPAVSSYSTAGSPCSTASSRVVRGLCQQPERGADDDGHEPFARHLPALGEELQGEAQVHHEACSWSRVRHRAKSVVELQATGDGARRVLPFQHSVEAVPHRPPPAAPRRAGPPPRPGRSLRSHCADYSGCWLSTSPAPPRCACSPLPRGPSPGLLTVGEGSPRPARGGGDAPLCASVSRLWGWRVAPRPAHGRSVVGSRWADHEGT